MPPVASRSRALFPWAATARRVGLGTVLDITLRPRLSSQADCLSRVVEAGHGRVRQMVADAAGDAPAVVARELADRRRHLAALLDGIAIALAPAAEQVLETVSELSELKAQAHRLAGRGLMPAAAEAGNHDPEEFA